MCTVSLVKRRLLYLITGFVEGGKGDTVRKLQAGQQLPGTLMWNEKRCCCGQPILLDSLRVTLLVCSDTLGQNFTRPQTYHKCKSVCQKMEFCFCAGAEISFWKMVPEFANHKELTCISVECWGLCQHCRGEAEVVNCKSFCCLHSGLWLGIPVLPSCILSR